MGIWLSRRTSSYAETNSEESEEETRLKSWEPSCITVLILIMGFFIVIAMNIILVYLPMYRIEDQINGAVSEANTAMGQVEQLVANASSLIDHFCHIFTCT